MNIKLSSYIKTVERMGAMCLFGALIGIMTLLDHQILFASESCSSLFVEDRDLNFALKTVTDWANLQKQPITRGYVNTQENIDNSYQAILRVEAFLNRRLHKTQASRQEKELLEVVSRISELKSHLLKDVSQGTYTLSAGFFTEIGAELRWYMPKYFNGKQLIEPFKVKFELYDQLLSSVWDFSEIPQQDRFNQNIILEKFIESISPYTLNLNLVNGDSFYNDRTAARSLTILGNDKKVEQALHVVDYRISHTPVGSYAFHNLLNDTLKFIADQYSKRGIVNSTHLERLKFISQELESRTVLFVSTKESANEVLRNDSAPPNKKNSGHFTIEGSLFMVESYSGNQLLPLEIFTGVRIPRRNPTEKIVEIGRHAVSPESAITSQSMIQAAANYARKTHKLSRIIIEADLVHARFFRKYGFEVIETMTRPDGSVDHIMAVSPQKLLKNLTK